ncbi:MAG: histidine kinase [Eggerthellales bacterium]|nr:histidine kinase [Eggerthellales bacterium]
MNTITMRRNYLRALDSILLAVLVLSGCLLVLSVYSPSIGGHVNLVAGVSFSIALCLIIYLNLNPDAVRARQSNTILNVASQTLEIFQEGLDIESSQKVCALLLPITRAEAVAITDREHVMGYVGLEQQSNPGGADIRTRATRQTLADGQIRVLNTPEEIGFPPSVKSLRAGIIVPLHRGEAIIGTLKFYFRSPREITENQIALAEGLGQLMSTQIAAVEMEEQAKLATTMELKALQAQINPHFLFNTINTIASLTRTDPDKARKLLRDFAVFYRATLENAQDLIELSREIEQTARYFSFEQARFGEDRIQLDMDVDEELEYVMVPAFMIQPLVENAVRHAMPQEGKLHIKISAWEEHDSLWIEVSDDGIGMDADQSQKLLRPEASKGLGIAMKNIHDRMIGYFGTESHMDVESALGEGTRVRLYLKDALIED